jgi:hypothetical protein
MSYENVFHKFGKSCFTSFSNAWPIEMCFTSFNNAIPMDCVSRVDHGILLAFDLDGNVSH